MKGAAETERERHPGIAADRAAIGHLGTGEKADQCRLAGTVGAENTEIVAGGDREAGIFQHGLAAGHGRVGFRDALEGDHSGSASLRRKTRSRLTPRARVRTATVAT